MRITIEEVEEEYSPSPALILESKITNSPNFYLPSPMNGDLKS